MRSLCRFPRLFRVLYVYLRWFAIGWVQIGCGAAAVNNSSFPAAKSSRSFRSCTDRAGGSPSLLPLSHLAVGVVDRLDDELQIAEGSRLDRHRLPLLVAFAVSGALFCDPETLTLAPALRGRSPARGLGIGFPSRPPRLPSGCAKRLPYT